MGIGRMTCDVCNKEIIKGASICDICDPDPYFSGSRGEIKTPFLCDEHFIEHLNSHKKDKQ